MTTSIKEDLAHEPEYAAVSVPSIFDPEISRAAHEAVFPHNSDVYGFINYGSSLKIACEGFDFLECKQTGRAPEECNDEDGPETLILVLKYEKDYLHAGVLEIIWEANLFRTDTRRTCLECAEHLQVVRYSHQVS